MNKFSRVEHLTPYDTDYHQWTVEQGRLLRDGKLNLLDRENLAEEIESSGRSEKREIESRLAVLLLHLLKWKYQSEKRKSGWEASIKVQRDRLKKALNKNPSLKNYPAEELITVYREARVDAEKETGLDFETFPEDCPFSIGDILDDGFLPG
ncbi:DUF29 domain-containing protein [Oricola sp.]|uniref:DUF29 domain-containing protein n=1 Tax=Oricola sp. TaxID=1979950 RepID=UPI003BAA1062